MRLGRKNQFVFGMLAGIAFIVACGSSSGGKGDSGDPLEVYIGGESVGTLVSVTSDTALFFKGSDGMVYSLKTNSADDSLLLAGRWVYFTGASCTGTAYLSGNFIKGLVSRVKISGTDSYYTTDDTTGVTDPGVVTYADSSGCHDASSDPPSGKIFAAELYTGSVPTIASGSVGVELK